MTQLTIESTKVLNNGLKMPLFGLGVWKATPEETIHAVSCALQAGYRHIDTAWIYGNEESVGKAIRDSGVAREDIFITTKLWRDHHDDPERAIESSLKRLGVDDVDLYLSHFPAEGTRIEAYKKMETFLKKGVVKSIGVSNYTVRHLEELLKQTSIVPAVNQVELHVFLQQRELVDYCEGKGIALEAYSPLAHAKRLDDPILSAIAQKHKKSPAQVMIRWCLEKGYVVIPKSVNEKRIQENASVYDFSFDEKDMLELTGLEMNLRTCWDPTDAP